jgi:hypothetical protein
MTVNEIVNEADKNRLKKPRCAENQLMMPKRKRLIFQRIQHLLRQRDGPLLCYRTLLSKTINLPHPRFSLAAESAAGLMEAF